MRSDLSPEQIQQFMAAFSEMSGGENPTEGSVTSSSSAGDITPPPTDEELREFLDYMGQGVLNTDRLEYEDNLRKREHEEEEEDSEEQAAIKRNKSASQYFYRQHYLSIIQEEEEKESENNTPSNSRPNSRPVSTYGGINPLVIKPQLLKRAIKEYQTHRADSWSSEVSVESLGSVNSILSEEASSESSSVNGAKGKRGSKTMSHIWDHVPPPPTSSAPVLMARANLTNDVTNPNGTDTNSPTTPESPQHHETAAPNEAGSSDSTITNSTSTSAESRRTSSVSSNDLSKDLPMDEIVIPDLLVNTTDTPSQEVVHLKQQDLSHSSEPKSKSPSKSNSAMTSQSSFSSMKEKLKNVIGAKSESPSSKSKSTGATNPQETMERRGSIGSEKGSAEEQTPSTVRRLFRSLSRRNSVKEREQPSTPEEGGGCKKATADTREGRSGNSGQHGSTEAQSCKSDCERQKTGGAGVGGDSGEVNESVRRSQMCGAVKVLPSPPSNCSNKSLSVSETNSIPERTKTHTFTPTTPSPTKECETLRPDQSHGSGSSGSSNAYPCSQLGPASSPGKSASQQSKPQQLQENVAKVHKSSQEKDYQETRAKLGGSGGSPSQPQQKITPSDKSIKRDTKYTRKEPCIDSRSMVDYLIYSKPNNNTTSLPNNTDGDSKQYQNVEDMYTKLDRVRGNKPFESSSTKPSPDNDSLSIAALISECEDYVKTEEFTKELSSHILQMFLDERMNSMRQGGQNVDPLPKDFDQHVYSNVSEEAEPTGTNNIYEQIVEGDLAKFPRGSVYENSSGQAGAAEKNACLSQVGARSKGGEEQVEVVEERGVVNNQVPCINEMQRRRDDNTEMVRYP